MQLVEQHIIRQSSPQFGAIDAASFAAKNLYNAANYLVRQSFIHENVYLNYYDVHAQMADAPDQPLPAHAQPADYRPAGC